MTAHARISETGTLSLDEAANMLGICGKTLAAYLKSNPTDPPLFAKFGRKYIISPDDLDHIYQMLQVTYGARRFFSEEFEQRLMPAPKPSRDDGFVYFAQNETSGLIKIGFALDPKRRLKTLATASADKLNLIGTMRGTIATERAVHAKFAKLRKRGEWFLPSPVLLNFAYFPETARIRAKL